MFLQVKDILLNDVCARSPLCGEGVAQSPMCGAGVAHRLGHFENHGQRDLNVEELAVAINDRHIRPLAIVSSEVRRWGS